MSSDRTPDEAPRLTPYEVVERLIGRAEVIGPIVGLDAKSPYRWRYSAKGRDGGDLPSTRIQRALLDHSDAHGSGLTAEHLIRGATEAEIAVILARRARPGGVAAE
jgi:hypothetical protein